MKSENESQAGTRWWDILAALLLFCAMITAATRLVVTQWTETLYIAQTMVFLGTGLGLALGQSRFSGRLSALIAAAYGLFLIPWQLGIPMVATFLWKDRLMIIGQRLVETVDLVVRQRPVNDNTFFLLLMSALFWVLGVHAGYSITRHASAWRAAIPAGLAVMVIHTYDPLLPRRAWFLAAFLLFSLLLVARTTYIQQRSHWKENRTYVPPDIGFDWIRFTLGASLLLIMFAWTAPALAESIPAANEAWHKIRRPWLEFQDKASNLFNSLQSSVGIVNELYGNSLSLGRGSELTDNPVMLVEAPARPFPGIRYYWRAISYDYYEDGQWRSTFGDKQAFDPNRPNLALPSYDGRRLATFSFIPQTSIITLYSVPQPVWFNLPGEAKGGLMPDGSLDLVAFEANATVIPGQKYQVRASLSAVTQLQLREAGTEYPDWIVENYLQLPPDITPRTRDLALRISEGLENPFDIATAVTEYLRGYEYQAVIDPPPANQETVDWWLFDYQSGFCQYYASAQVVMLRSLGIPARMAVGYAQGEFDGRGADIGPDGSSFTDPEDFTDRGGTYLVRQRDFHAWPEVYFPGYGWVEFEPTASQSAIERPSGSQPGAGMTDDELERARMQRERMRDLLDDEWMLSQIPPEEVTALMTAEKSANITWVMVGAIPVGLSLVAIYFWRRNSGYRMRDFTPLPVRLERGIRRLGFKPPKIIIRWARHASLSPFTHSYMEINRALRRLGSPPALDDTPAERAAALAALLPASSVPVNTLLTQYHFTMFSQKPGDILSARLAGAEIRKLSYRALLMALISGRAEAYSKLQR